MGNEGVLWGGADFFVGRSRGGTSKAVVALSAVGDTIPCPWSTARWRAADAGVWIGRPRCLTSRCIITICGALR